MLNSQLPRFDTARSCDAAPHPIRATQYVAAVHRGCATEMGKGTYGAGTWAGTYGGPTGDLGDGFLAGEKALGKGHSKAVKAM